MKFFAAKGHEMHLISFAEVPEERVKSLASLGITYHGNTGNLHLKKFWLTLSDLRFVRSVLEKYQIDILHSHFLGANVWYGALSGFHPHVVTVMGGDVTGENWRPNRSIQDRILTPYALRNADAITAWSTMLARRVEPFTREGTIVDVVHGGVDLAKFCPSHEPSHLRDKLGIPADARLIFSPRLMRPLYNIDCIAQAAGIVGEKRSDVYFLLALPSVILDNAYYELVQDILKENAATERVRFLPSIDHTEMPDFYRLADVTVSIPSTDGTPMAVLESMACGTPTVIGALPDYNDDYFIPEKTTIMVNVKDPQSIAGGILRLLDNGDLASTIAHAALEGVRATGRHEYQMNKMEAVYKRIALPRD